MIDHQVASRFTLSVKHGGSCVTASSSPLAADRYDQLVKALDSKYTCMEVGLA